MPILKNVVPENGGTEKFQYGWKKPVLEKDGSLLENAGTYCCPFKHNN